MTERRATIQNSHGLHARLAAKLVQAANQFSSDITLVKESQTADAKSIMSVLILAAGPGAELGIQARGADERQAAESIAALINRRFDVED